MDATNPMIEVELYWGWVGDDDVIRVSGEANADAMPQLAAEASNRLTYDVSDLGHGGSSPFFLWSDLGDDEPVLDFVVLDPSVSFADLRAIVGTRGERVRLVVGAFGGDGLDPFSVWTLADLWDVISITLTGWGALDAVTRVGRATRKRMNRERWDAVGLWIHQGGDVPQHLQDEVARSFEWTESQLSERFGLDRGEAMTFMRACGYNWSAERRCYFAPDRDIDAVT